MRLWMLLRLITSAAIVPIITEVIGQIFPGVFLHGSSLGYARQRCPVGQSVGRSVGRKGKEPRPSAFQAAQTQDVLVFVCQLAWKKEPKIRKLQSSTLWEICTPLLAV